MRDFLRQISFAMVAMLAFLGTVEAGVVPPNQSANGHTQLDWSQQWWQWALGIPTSGNPLLDTSGSQAQLDNNRGVFFLAGSISGVPINRTIAVPFGKPVFFPVVNNVDAEIASPTCFQTAPADPLACALAFITGTIDNATNLSASVDGVEVLNDTNKGPFRQTSTSFFDLTLPPGNLLGLPPGSYPGSGVSDGYWVMLDGLTPGTHTVSFRGTEPGVTVDVTDTLLVFVPEPSAALLLLSGIAALVAVARSRFRRRRYLVLRHCSTLPRLRSANSVR